MNQANTNKESKPTKPRKERGEKKATKRTKQRKGTDKKPLTAMEKYGLNMKQELFCQYYASPSEYFGNGTQSYIQAYDIDVTQKGAYASARACASLLLTKVNICQRIDALLEELGLNDMFVDKQLSFLISQHGDFSAKLGAIREYNKMRERITDKVEHSFVAPITRIIIEGDDDELENDNSNSTTTSPGDGADSEVQTDEEATPGA
jgi:hypothetical protein